LEKGGGGQGGPRDWSTGPVRGSARSGLRNKTGDRPTGGQLEKKKTPPTLGETRFNKKKKKPTTGFLTTIGTPRTQPLGGPGPLGAGEGLPIFFARGTGGEKNGGRQAGGRAIRQEAGANGGGALEWGVFSGWGVFWGGLGGGGGGGGGTGQGGCGRRGGAGGQKIFLSKKTYKKLWENTGWGLGSRLRFRWGGHALAPTI